MLGVSNLVTRDVACENELRLSQLEGARKHPFSSGRGRSHATEIGDLLILEVRLETYFRQLLLCIDSPGVRVCARIAAFVDDYPYSRVVIRINDSQVHIALIFVPLLLNGRCLEMRCHQSAPLLAKRHRCSICG